MIYFFILTLLIFFWLNLRTSSQYHYFPFLLLFLFSAFRVDAGYDYGTYIELLNSGYFVAIFEPVSLAIGFISNFFGYPQMFFIINSAIFLFSLYLFLKKEQQKFIFLILYFSFPFCFLDSFSIVRQYLALSFLLIAYALYIRNKLWASIFITLSAFAHKSALIAITPVIILLMTHMSISRYIASFALPALILIVFSIHYVTPKIDYFSNIDSSGAWGFKAAIFWLSLSLPFILMSKKYLAYYKDPVISITLVGIGIYAGLSFYGGEATRIFAFFAPFATLFIARSISLHFGKYSIFFASTLSGLILLITLYGAASNTEFDFLNDYKIYPSECNNCNIRLE